MNTIKSTIVILIMACCLPAAGYCDMSGSSEGSADTPSQADIQSLLNVYSALADEHLNCIIRDLRLLASTSEVGSGKWEDMHGLLTKFDKDNIAAAAVWYARPDGGYYTAKDGSTGKSLADRPYFPGLIAGSEVAGELVISRSTGKRSAVFAVPVTRGGKTTGALGVSVSVDELSRILKEKMGLPPNIVFYALDSKGRVSLHGKLELLFKDPFGLGSDTLNEAVKKMLSENEGVVSYEFQGKKTVYFKRSSLTGWVYALGIITDAAPIEK